MSEEGPEYVNHKVSLNGHTYRVCLHRGGRVLVVARLKPRVYRSDRGEVGLNIDGPTAQKLIGKARRGQVVT